MNAKAIIRMPGEGKEVTLAGQPMAFLVTGEDSKHTCMFDWTLPAGFSTGLHVHRVQEETFYVLEGECEWQLAGQLIRADPERTCSFRRACLTTSVTPARSRRGCS
jgi:quercetin dioxygenase-like cupin family protein